MLVLGNVLALEQLTNCGVLKPLLLVPGHLITVLAVTGALMLIRPIFINWFHSRQVRESLRDWLCSSGANHLMQSRVVVALLDRPMVN